jgi:4-hydroxy-3-methylbut-2-enyl diphosphate reductase
MQRHVQTPGEAKEISRAADAMIVIGGRTSANSLKLAEICKANCKRVFFVETADELDISDFSESDTVGITAGASTPAWIIKEVCQMLSEEMNIGETVGQAGSSDMPVDVSGAAEAVESFEELLEKSIKTLNTGEKVTGIVAAITPTEISVDSVQSSRVTYP